MRDVSYKLDNEQMDNLRQYIDNHYLNKVLQSYVLELTSTDPEDDAGNLQTNSASSAINGQRSNGVHPTPPLPSFNNILDDISFLGPGQMPQPSDSSQFSTDLSMLGPGEIYEPSREMPYSKGGRASLTENMREQASLLLNHRSHTPEKQSSRPEQEESEGEESPDSTERKRLLSTWLSPSKKSFGPVATSARKWSSSSVENIHRTSLTKEESGKAAESSSAQQWVSSLFMKSDSKPCPKGRRSVKKEPSNALTFGRRRGPFRKSSRIVQQGNLLP